MTPVLEFASYKRSLLYGFFFLISSNFVILELLYKAVNQRAVSTALAIALRSSNDHWATFDLLHDPAQHKKQRSEPTEVGHALPLFHYGEKQHDYQFIMTFQIHNVTYEDRLSAVTFCAIILRRHFASNRALIHGTLINFMLFPS